jgi:hypothetical protein
MLRALLASALLVSVTALWTACDSKATTPEAPAPIVASDAAAAAPPPPPAPTAPEIIVDRSNIDIGKNRVATGEPGLTDKIAVFLRGSPGLAGAVVDVVAMRSVKPSQVQAVLTALRQANVASVDVKTETREGETRKLPLFWPKTLPDCATMAWIAKDAAIDIWPVGGGAAKRVIRGLAGPDLTLGMEAFQKQAADCQASYFVVGADDAMSWGVVFDLAMAALHQPWTRTSGAELLASAVPGHKVAL